MKFICKYWVLYNNSLWCCTVAWVTKHLQSIATCLNLYSSHWIPCIANLNISFPFFFFTTCGHFQLLITILQLLQIKWQAMKLFYSSNNGQNFKETHLSKKVMIFTLLITISIDYKSMKYTCWKHNRHCEYPSSSD